MTDEAIELQQHELELIAILTEASPYSKLISDNIRETKIISLDFTRVGYFLTLSHTDFPEERYVCDEPYVGGKIDDIEVGFLIFLMNHELTIECHTYGTEFPKSFRTRTIALTTE